MKYYALIPHTIDAYGEENILSDLQKMPPDYVVITNKEYIFTGYFGVHYAKQIAQYFIEHYKTVKLVDFNENNVNAKFMILKKKS